MSIRYINHFGSSNSMNVFKQSKSIGNYTSFTFKLPNTEEKDYILCDIGLISDLTALVDTNTTFISVVTPEGTTSLQIGTQSIGTTQSVGENTALFFTDVEFLSGFYINSKWAGEENYLRIVIYNTSSLLSKTLIDELENDYPVGSFKQSLVTEDHSTFMICDGRLLVKEDYPELVSKLNIDEFYLSSDNTLTKEMFFRLPNQNNFTAISGCKSTDSFGNINNAIVGGHKHYTIIGSHSHTISTTPSKNYGAAMASISNAVQANSYMSLTEYTATTTSTDLGTKTSGTVLNNSSGDNKSTNFNTEFYGSWGKSYNQPSNYSGFTPSSSDNHGSSIIVNLFIRVE